MELWPTAIGTCLAVAMVTWRSALLGLLTGALLGASLQAVRAVIDLWLHLRGVPNFGSWAVAHGALNFLAYLPFWAASLVLVGWLPWLAVPPLRQGGAQKLVVVSAALAMTFYAGLATGGFGLSIGPDHSAADGDGPTWLHGALTSHGWRALLFSAAFHGVTAATAVLVGWRISYRPRCPA